LNLSIKSLLKQKQVEAVAPSREAAPSDTPTLLPPFLALG
jgi:hypothetical protein